MTQPNNQPQFAPVIDDTKVPPEIAIHLRILYEKLINHGIAFENVQNQLNAMNKTGGK